MILLDTDHLSVLIDLRDARHALLSERLEATTEPIGVAIVSIEEVLRGWLAFIHRLRDVHRQIPAYDRLGKLLDGFSHLEVMPFDSPSADKFSELRRRRIRIGTMDLKIASIALVNDALIVMANTQDFGRAPELRYENWLA
ncbi:MAG: type II toxin-antitoxin system VapC family toxin [Planctomycetaceae bacterium]